MNKMTSDDIQEFFDNYISGKDADKIAAMIYNTYGMDADASYPEIPKGGVVEEFNEADYGEDVREKAVKLTLLIRGYLRAIGSLASNAANELRETYEQIDFKEDGVHFGDELFIDPGNGGTPQAVLHGRRTLDSNDDLNDIVDQGFYYYKTNSLPANYATKRPSLVIVFSTNGGTIKAQIAVNSLNRIDYRTKAGTSDFTEWTRMPDRSDANMPTDQECIDAGANILPFIYSAKIFENPEPTLEWIGKTAQAQGYWKLVGDTTSGADRYFRIVNSPSELPLGIQPGKDYRVGLYCEIGGQPYIDDGEVSDAGLLKHPIYLRIVEKRQNDSDINHSYFAGYDDVLWTVDDDCVGIVIDCYVKRGSTFGGNVKFLPSIRAARTNAELTEKTKRMRVREIAADNPEDPALTGLYFDADKMFVGVDQNNIKEILHYQRALTSSDKLADIKESGIYIVRGADRPLDSPTTQTSCVWAIVSPTGKYRSLILINTANRMYHRSWDGVAWTDWHRVIDREDHGDTRDVPKNSGVYNAYKRAHQLLDLKYDPSDTYKTTWDYILPGENKYVGVPHSSVKEAELYIGFDVSIRTFMTAMHNPYSLMHTECVRHTSSKFDYYRKLVDELDTLIDENGTIKDRAENRATVIMGILSEEFGIEFETTGNVVSNYEYAKGNIQNGIDTKESNFNGYKQLANELDTLIDENGTIEDGAEDRATYIMSTLSDAFNIEFETSGNVVSNYEDAKADIQNGIWEYTKPFSITKYDMTYRGGYGTQGPFYGTACSTFVLYSLGFKSRWINANFEYLVERGVLSHVIDNSPTGVQLMDILQWQQEDNITPDHCTMVTDIYRNERGVPTEIWVSESTMAQRYVVNGEVAESGRKYIVRNGVVQEKVSGKYVDNTDLTYNVCIGCRTTRFTLAQFKSYMTIHNIRIFRYNFIEENLEYDPSDFVAVEDEAKKSYEYNDDICTYAGDYAVFRTQKTFKNEAFDGWLGFPVLINYNDGRGEDEQGNPTGPIYTKMEVRKEEGPWEEISLPPNYNTTHSINVTEYCNEHGPGFYTAYLYSPSKNSAPTHWEVIDTTTTVEKTVGSGENSRGSMENLTVRFNSDANPVYIEFVSERGNQWGLYELSAEEIAAGAVEGLNAKEYIKNSIGKVTKPKYDQHDESEYYVRVKYQGTYGGVTSRMVNVVNPDKSIGIDTDDAGTSTSGGDSTDE